MLADGMRRHEVAKRLRVSPSTVTRWAAEERLLETAEAGAASVREELQALAVTAVARMRSLLDSKDESIVVRVTQMVLDRAGYGPGAEIQVGTKVDGLAGLVAELHKAGSLTPAVSTVDGPSLLPDTDPSASADDGDGDGDEIG